VLNRTLPGKLTHLLVPIQFTATTIVSLILIVIGLHLYFQYYEGFSISTSQLLLFVTIYGVAALLYNTLFFSNHFLQKENMVKIAAEQQQRDVLEMEMIEFKSDINPELLFESLESLINLMYKDVEQAEEYIDCLASAYRYVLSNRSQELVPAALELEAARNLITLLNQKYFGQIRFEPSMDVNELKALLIPGSLPVIIEGLVRNTIVSPFEPLTIRCYLEDDYITIQSKLNDRLSLSPSAELAFTRLQESYSFYSDQPMIKVKAYEENYVKLPVIHVAEEMMTQ
jgi:sensor histidine kinase YesM